MIRTKHFIRQACLNSPRCVDCFNDYLRACDPRATEWTLRRLSKHSSSRIRSAVAENKRTPGLILWALATDPSVDVRLSVSENLSTSENTIEILIADDSVDVRYGLAENINLPRRFLERLADDENPFVSTRALKSLRLFETLQSDQVLLDRLVCEPTGPSCDREMVLVS